MKTAGGMRWRFMEAYHRLESSASPLKYTNRLIVPEGARLRESRANAGRPVIPAQAALPLNSAELFATAYYAPDPAADVIKWANRPAALIDSPSLAPLANTTLPSIAAPTGLPDNEVADLIDTG
jgi:hypothetical protein